MTVFVYTSRLSFNVNIKSFSLAKPKNACTCFGYNVFLFFFFSFPYHLLVSRLFIPCESDISGLDITTKYKHTHRHKCFINSFRILETMKQFQTIWLVCHRLHDSTERGTYTKKKRKRKKRRKGNYKSIFHMMTFLSLWILKIYFICFATSFSIWLYISSWSCKWGSLWRTPKRLIFLWT